MSFHTTLSERATRRTVPAGFPTFQQVKTVGRFGMHFVEMSIAMIVGMQAYMAIPGVMALPRPLHLLGMAIAMSAPMVGWMPISWSRRPRTDPAH